MPWFSMVLQQIMLTMVEKYQKPKQIITKNIKQTHNKVPYYQNRQAAVQIRNHFIYIHQVFVVVVVVDKHKMDYIIFDQDHQSNKFMEVFYQTMVYM